MNHLDFALRAPAQISLDGQCLGTSRLHVPALTEHKYEQNDNLTRRAHARQGAGKGSFEGVLPAWNGIGTA
jgi:hypothetical protein